MYNGLQDVSRTIERNKNKISRLNKSKTIIQRVGNIKFENFSTFLTFLIFLSRWIQYAYICMHMDTCMSKLNAPG